MKARLAHCVLAAVTATGLSAARAETLDPAFPEPLILGEPIGILASERVNRERTNRSTFVLPTVLDEVGRAQVGAFVLPPTIDADGEALVATVSAEVVALSLPCIGNTSSACANRQPKRRRVGSSPATAPLVRLSSGKTAMLVGSPALVILAPDGTLEATVALPRGAFPTGPSHADASVALVATLDGGLVLTAQRLLLVIDSSGRILTKTTLPDRLASPVMPFGDGFVGVLESGFVIAIQPPLAPRVLGTVGAIVPRSAVLMNQRTLLVTTPTQRTVTFDLIARKASTPFADLQAPLHSPPSLAQDGSVWIVGLDGMVLGLTPDGQRNVVVPAEKGLPANRAPDELFGAGDLSPLVDRDGQVAFARPGGRLGLIERGKLSTTTDRACNVPVFLTLIGDKDLLVGCRDGTLIRFGEPKETQSAKP